MDPNQMAADVSDGVTESAPPPVVPEIEAVSETPVDDADELSADAIERLRAQTAKSLEARGGRKVNLRPWFSGEGAQEDSVSEMAVEARAEPEPALETRHEPSKPKTFFIGQIEAREQVERAIAAGRKLILVVGPAGCGKTTYLDTLEGVRLVDVDAAGTEALNEALESDQPVVAAVRGKAPQPAFVLMNGPRSRAIFTSESLVDATDQKIPLAVAERVDCVAPFEPLNEVELDALAERLLSPGQVSSEARALLSREAYRSGRGAHELIALLRRLPPGSDWRLPEKAGKKPTKVAAKPAKAAAKSKPQKKGRR